MPVRVEASDHTRVRCFTFLGVSMLYSIELRALSSETKAQRKMRMMVSIGLALLFGLIAWAYNPFARPSLPDLQLAIASIA